MQMWFLVEGWKELEEYLWDLWGEWSNGTGRGTSMPLPCALFTGCILLGVL